MTALQLEQHRAAVVGASGTIGSAICSAYAAAGATVVALDLDAELARHAVAGLPGEHHVGQIDVTDIDSVEHAADEAGSVDSVVYSVGIAFTADVTQTDWRSYRRLMSVNLDGAFHIGASFARRMIDGGREGSFVFLSSTAGRRGEAGAAAYCASKFGLIGFVESFAAELTMAGIRVNAVCPGNVDSPLLRAVAADVAERERRTTEEVIDRFVHSGAAQRLVAADEVAAVVVWLGSPLASAMTGATVGVDAGQLVG